MSEYAVNQTVSKSAMFTLPVVSVVVTVALVCLTSLPLVMLIMGEFQFARLHSALARAACDCGQYVEVLSGQQETELTLFVGSEIKFFSEGF
jgi:hypothetical protein